MYNFIQADRIGDNQVRVYLMDDQTEDLKEYIWTKDDDQTLKKFITMVKGEVKAHLKHLNKTSVVTDVTDQYA